MKKELWLAIHCQECGRPMRFALSLEWQNLEPYRMSATCECGRATYSVEATIGVTTLNEIREMARRPNARALGEGDGG